MPLVLMCGLPCSGKSSAAAALVEMFKLAGADAVIIDEASLHLDRIGAYCGEPRLPSLACCIDLPSRALLKRVEDLSFECIYCYFPSPKMLWHNYWT